MALLLEQKDILRLLDMAELIPALEKAQVEYSQGKALPPMRFGVKTPPYPGSLDLMPGYLEESDALGVKVLSLRRDNPRLGLPLIHATLLLHDPLTGRLLALMEAASLTAARTAAVSGVATKYLARAEAFTLAVVGTGRQARTHLWAMATVRPIQQVRAYNLHPEGGAAFKREVEDRFGLPVQVVSSAREAIRGADIVVLSTTAVEPILRGDWLEEGMHINSIASATPQVRELDSEAIRRSKVVVDSREAALHEAGDLLIPMAEGVITADHIYAEVGEIASGAKPGRTGDREVTLYKSLGLALQDVAAAKLLYQKALESGVGREVDL